MREFFYSLFFLLLLGILSYPHFNTVILSRKMSIAAKSSGVTNPRVLSKPNPEDKKVPARFSCAGERIVYVVKLGKVSLGQAVFSCLGPEELEGRRVNLMTFETKLVRFNDKEKIYSDPDTFLPLKVERSISNWPLREEISEYYDQKGFILTILKNNSRRHKPVVIKKGAPLHNAIMLPFYVRSIPELAPGWSMSANLPNQRFEIRLISMEDVEVPGGNFKAYRFESNPKRFEIWVSSDERRIPLKIKGSGALGYVFLMKEYTGSKRAQAGHDPAARNP